MNDATPPSTARPRRGRWVLIAVVSLAAFCVSGVELARRIHAYHEARPPTLYYFRPVEIRDFEFAQRPVHVEDKLDENGQGTVVVTYGEASLEIPVSIPVRFKDLPGLASHQDWLRILIIREGESFDADTARNERRQGVARGRCVIVTRLQRPGADPETFGEVFKHDWQFDFYELTPDGEIERLERLAYPEGERSLARRQRNAKAQGKPVPERRENELKEGTWQFYAAMQVMPSGSVPSQSFASDALTSSGWPLPVAAMSMPLFVLSLALAVAPRRAQ
ncbi:MAG: hypothetical protein H6811_06825 [Phycisphaeraceae bacterium]|nr:hypothetical protein [Phycisphaeraceae bacterium]